MTEYELLDLMASMEAHMASQFSLYLTIISSYMVVAYLVGNKLTNTQVVIVSTLMILSAGGQTWALHTTLGRVTEYLERKVEFSALTEYEQNFSANTYAWVVILVGGLLASLFFMWQVRHHKTE